MRPTEPLRDEHRELVEHIEHLALAAREIPRLSDEERDLLRDRMLEFLRGTLLPHAAVEEEILYPEWAALVGFPAAAEPMIHDHAAIVAYVQRLEAADAADADELQAALYGLHALIAVHFAKEEDIQMAAFDAAPAATERVLRRVAAVGGHAHAH
jgi:hemerythrin